MSLKQFRYDIGFLRAIAVISVLLFHFKVPFFQGGFLGVDIFFVISGYLMTLIILRGFTRSNFSLKTFYVKRIKRIFPVLIIVGFVILFVSILLFLNNDAAQNAKNVVLSSLFISNIYYWLYNGYFDPASHGNIFLHSWSLSVEWQFYLIYPLLLLAVKKVYLKAKKIFIIGFLSFTIISLLLCLWVTQFDNSFAFYMFPTRAWEMTIGGVAFLFARKIEDRLSFTFRKIAVSLAYLTILLSLYFIDSSDLWPSYFTLIPVIATFTIIALNIDFKWLHSKVFQFFGDISYSLYLWHWPVFIIFQYFGLLDNLSVIYMTLISILLSVFSYYLVEKNSWFSSIKFVKISLPLILVLGFITFKYPENNFSKSISLYDSETYKTGNYASYYNQNIREQQFNSSGCFVTIGDKKEDYNWQDCLQIDDFKKNVLLIGDSHAAQFSQSLQEKLGDSINLMEFNMGISFPFQPAKGQKESVKLIDKFYAEFLPLNIEKIDLVVLSLHWPMHSNPQIDYSKQDLIIAYKEFLNYFKRNGVKILVIGQQESYTIAFSKIILLQKLLDKDNHFINRYIDIETKKDMEWVLEHTPRLQLLDIYNLDNIEKIDSVGVPYMVDKNHYTKMGADQMVEKVIIPKINEILN